MHRLAVKRILFAIKYPYQNSVFRSADVRFSRSSVQSKSVYFRLGFAQLPKARVQLDLQKISYGSKLENFKV